VITSVDHVPGPPATRWVTYSGDVTESIVGRMFGSMVACDATYDTITGKSRVGFRVASPEDGDRLRAEMADYFGLREPL